MTRQIGVSLLLAGFILSIGFACTRRPPAREFQLRGQVLAVNPDRGEITIRHENIEGFMPAMTMPFTVRDKPLLEGRVPGDLVTARLVVTDDNAYLDELRKVGYQALPARPVVSAAPDAILDPGQPVPDVRLVDQDGRGLELSSLRGTTLVVTFIYTRCPLPNFCPLMDRHFAAIQEAIRKDPGLNGRVRLLSISFDPAFDTPDVLKKHAAQAGADPAIWSFLSGEQAAVDAFAGRFGLSVIRDASAPGNITHNLRTAVIDRQGRVVRYFGGNDWTPDQVVAALDFVAKP